MEQNIRLIEEAYVSTGNSGIGIKVHEHTTSSGIRYTLTIHHGAFGHHSEFSTPIINLDHARAMAEILARTTVLMSQRPDELDNYDAARRVFNEVRQGMRYTALYEEYIDSPWSTTTYHVGDRITDANTGQFIKDELFPLMREHSGSGGGSTSKDDAPYKEEDVGRMLVRGGGIHPSKRIDHTRVIKGSPVQGLGLLESGKQGHTLVKKIVSHDTEAEGKTEG